MWVCVINMLEMKFAVVYVLLFLAAVAFVPDVPSVFMWCSLFCNSLSLSLSLAFISLVSLQPSQRLQIQLQLAAV